MENGTSLEEICKGQINTASMDFNLTQRRKIQAVLWGLLPHERCTQSFVEPLDALRLEELLGNLRSRHSSRRLNRRAGDVGAAGHGVGGQQLRRRDHDWLLLLRSCKENRELEHRRPTSALKRCFNAAHQFCQRPEVGSSASPSAW